MKTTYELKAFKNSTSPDLTKALKLYSDNIEPEYRTDTNEIIFWIDNFQKRFNDEFYILGLYLNGVLIGFTEIAFFKEEKFVEVDYLVIEKNHRKNNTFYEFLDKINDFLFKENIVFDYIICEVGCYFENMQPTESSKTLIRLLKMSHFGVIKCSYYVPRLGKINYESQMRAILMIYGTNDIKQIKKETYLMIVNALFYKYYQRWYNDFFNDSEKQEYQEILDDLFEKIKRDVNNRKVIEINGYSNLLPLNPNDFNEVKAKKGIQILVFIFLFLVSLLIFGSVALFIKSKFEIDIENQAAILSISVLAASIITSSFFGNKSNLAAKLIEKLIEKL